MVFEGIKRAFLPKEERIARQIEESNDFGEREKLEGQLEILRARRERAVHRQTIRAERRIEIEKKRASLFEQKVRTASSRATIQKHRTQAKKMAQATSIFGPSYKRERKPQSYLSQSSGMFEMGGNKKRERKPQSYLSQSSGMFEMGGNKRSKGRLF